MLIPQGDWCVVARPVRSDPGERGQIIKPGLTEKQARERAKRGYAPGWNCWAMERRYY